MTTGQISGAARAEEWIQERGSGWARTDKPVSIDVLGGIVLPGDLKVPATAAVRDAIAFPHVSREPRRSHYNRAAVSALDDAGFG